MKKGFTLVELLVVVSLIGLFTVGAIWNIVTSKRISALGRTAEEVALKLREFQNKSLISELPSGSFPCGFGIHYKDDKSLIFFTEAPEAGGYECIFSGPDQSVDRQYGGLGEEQEEIFFLKEGNYVKIQGSFPDIYFEPPDGLVYIDGGRDLPVASISLCLRSNCSTYQKVVKVYLGGRIEIE